MLLDCSKKNKIHYQEQKIVCAKKTLNQIPIRI